MPNIYNNQVKAQIQGLYPMATTLAEKEALANQYFGGSLAKLYNLASRLKVTRPVIHDYEVLCRCVDQMPPLVRELWIEEMDNLHEEMGIPRGTPVIVVAPEPHNHLYRKKIVPVLAQELLSRPGIGQERCRWLTRWAISGVWDELVIALIQEPDKVYESMELVFGKSRNPLTRPIIRDLRSWIAADWGLR
jgi:hypothetical protein